MPTYKHTQIGYLMIAIVCIVLPFFTWLYINSLSEPVSVDSGPNLLMTSVMILVTLILISFTALTVAIDEKYLKIKFGFGMLSFFQKKFLLSDIVSAEAVRNHWYYGFGIKVWYWPYMWLYTVSGLDAVEIVMKKGKIFRIGTDKPKELEIEINKRKN